MSPHALRVGERFGGRLVVTAEIDEVGSSAPSDSRPSVRSLISARRVVPEEAIVLLDGNHDYITPAGGVGLAVRRREGRP
jgi:hypothetical protein